MRALIVRALALALAGRAAAAAPAQGPPGDDEEIVDPLDTRPAPTVAARAAPPVVASFSGYAWSQLDVDTRLDNGREAAGAWRNHAYLRLSVAPSPSLRAVASLRLRTWSTVERNESRAPFLVVNGEGWRSGYEVTPGDAFVELAPAAPLRLILGLQTFGWGQNELLGPSDPLNPRDLRWGLPAELAETIVPVPAATAAVSAGPLLIELVWLPFFTPSRGWLVGQDFALFSPGGSELPVDLRGVLPDNLQDALQGSVLAGFAPEPSPDHGSAAVRVSGRAAGVELAAGYRFGYDSVPTVVVDPELGQLLVEAASPSPRLLTISTLLSRLAPRLAAGERLATGEHRRQHLVFGDAARAVGPFVLKVDAAFAHEQAFYTTSSELPLGAVHHPTLIVAAGVDYRYRDALFVNVQWSWLKMFGAGGAGEDPLLFAAPSLHTAAVLVRAPIWHGHVDAQVAAIAGLTQHDWVLQPMIAWRLGPHLSLSGGVSIWQGEGRSPGGFFDHNDAAFVRARAPF